MLAPGNRRRSRRCAPRPRPRADSRAQRAFARVPERAPKPGSRALSCPCPIDGHVPRGHLRRGGKLAREGGAPSPQVAKRLMREAPQVSALPELFGLARTTEWGGNPERLCSL